MYTRLIHIKVQLVEKTLPIYLDEATYTLTQYLYLYQFFFHPVAVA